MDIVNKALPTGSKLIKLSGNYGKLFENIFSRSTIEAAYVLQKALNLAQSNSDMYPSPYRLSKLIITKDASDFPIVSVNKHDFLALNTSFREASATLKASYASPTYCPYSGVYMEHKDLTLQWDPSRQALIQHNVSYEGELVNNKPMVINRQLNEWVLERVNTLALEALIGAGEADLAVTSGYYYNSIDRAKDISELLPKVLTDNYETKDVSQLALAFGLYESIWNTNLRSYSINIETKKKSKIQLSAPLRTKLIYLLGGYQLPEDYQQWFDG